MAYKMKGSPAKRGIIEGTSAFKLKGRYLAIKKGIEGIKKLYNSPKALKWAERIGYGLVGTLMGGKVHEAVSESSGKKVSKGRTTKKK